MQFEIDNVLNVLDTVYLNKNQDPDKDQKLKYLNELQKSNQAWELAFKILSINKSIELNFFAAQTLKQKVQLYFYELPQSHYNSFQNTLYTLLSYYNSSNQTIVLNQLRLVVADFIILSPNIINALKEFLEKFDHESNEATVLDVLINLVDELHNKSLKIGSVKRQEISNQLTQYAPSILKKLDSIVAKYLPEIFDVNTRTFKSDCQNQTIISQVLASTFKCMERWIDCGIIEIDSFNTHLSNTNIQQSTTNQSNNINIIIPNYETLIGGTVLERAIEILLPLPNNYETYLKCLDKTLHGKAIDILIAIIITIEEPSLYPDLTQLLLSTMYQMHNGIFKHCITSTINSPSNAEDSDSEHNEISTNYCTLFCEMANLCLTAMITNPNQGFGDLKLLQVMLECLNSQDIELAEITYTFWYNFAECLYNNTSVTKDDQKLALFQPSVNGLLQCLFPKIMLESDYDEIPNVRDDIGETRQQIFSLIQDVSFASDPIGIVNQMIGHADNINTQPHQKEAAYFITSALIKEILRNKNLNSQSIDQTFDALLTSITNESKFIQYMEIWSTFPTLLYTCFEVLQEMARCIVSSDTSKIKTVLDRTLYALTFLGPYDSPKCAFELKNGALSVITALFNALIMGQDLSNNHTSSANTLTLICSVQNNQYLSTLLSFAQSCSNSTTDFHKKNAAKGVNKTNNVMCLDRSCKQELIEAISILIPYLQDPQMIAQCLSIICDKLVAGLALEINNKNNGLQNCDPTPWLDQITALFKPFALHKKRTNMTGLLTPVLVKVWPVLNQLFLTFQDSEQKTERICRSLKHIFRAIGKDGTAYLLPHLLTTILPLYQNKHHSSYVYLASVLVEEFHSVPEYQNGLIDIFENFTQCFVQLLCFTIQKHNIIPNLNTELSFENFDTVPMQAIVQAAKQIPDNVEDYFRLCQKAIKISKITEMLQRPMMEGGIIFRIFIAICFLDHREAHSAAMLFLTDFINIPSSHQSSMDDASYSNLKTLVTSHYMNKYGLIILRSLLLAICFFLSPQLYPEVADVFYELMAIDKKGFSNWMDLALQDIRKRLNCVIQAYQNNTSSLGSALNNSNPLLSFNQGANSNDVYWLPDLPNFPASFLVVSASHGDYAQNSDNTCSHILTDQILHQFTITILNATQEKHITRAFREFALLFK